MWSTIGDLMYEDKNLDATVEYCQARNSFIKDTPKADVKHKVLQRVQNRLEKLTPEQLQGGVMFEDFSVYYIIDPNEHPGIKVENLPMTPGHKPAKYAVNFFARMGRELC